jgi:hypothetical protein
MIKRIPGDRQLAAVLGCVLTVMSPMTAAENSAADTSGSASASINGTASATSETEQLKRMLADQQRQIDELRRMILQQSKASANVIPGVTVGSEPQAVAAPAVPTPAAPAAAPATNIMHPNLGEVASASPVLPPGPPAPTARAFPAILPPQEPSGESPLQLKIGNAYITPVGFMDMTEVSRSTNPGSGIGTNFGSVPYGNTQTGSLTESRLSIQNSRIGARVDALVGNMKVLGYWESDFLGQLGNPPNGGLAVTSNPYVFRLRLYWVDVTKGKFEFLAGQSWSLMTPNRKGISPLPGDIFYSQDVDVNYQLGLVWGRIPGYRLGYHFSDKAALAVAFENSEPYVGGGNGGSAITAPSAIAGILGTQVNNGTSVISSAALAPDIIAKLAFDPSSKFHFEIAGVEIANKIANPASTPAFQTDTKVGGGGSVNLSFELAKNLRILTNNYWSAGGGRYIFGQAPDFIIRSNGSLSLVHSASTVTGLEYTLGKTLYYAYYGGVYIDKNMALDANGKTLIGYGPIASDGQNRAIQEITFGTNTTLVRDAKWGALNMMFQFSYVQRNPWLVATGAPTSAHVDMGFFNFRYTLPGAAPTLGR